MRRRDRRRRRSACDAARLQVNLQKCRMSKLCRELGHQRVRRSLRCLHRLPLPLSQGRRPSRRGMFRRLRVALRSKRLLQVRQLRCRFPQALRERARVAFLPTCQIHLAMCSKNRKSFPTLLNLLRSAPHMTRPLALSDRLSRHHRESESRNFSCRLCQLSVRVCCRNPKTSRFSPSAHLPQREESHSPRMSMMYPHRQQSLVRRL